jgi:hypothetical protein
LLISFSSKNIDLFLAAGEAAASGTNASENYFLADDFEFSPDFSRSFDPVKFYITEIDNCTTLDAMSMVMRFEIGIVATRATETLDHLSQTNLDKSQKRAVDCVQRNIGETLVNAGVQLLGCGMFAGTAEFRIDCLSLWRDPESALTTGPAKQIACLRRLPFLHVVIK